MIDGKDKQGQLRQRKLNDGLWHRVDVFKQEKVCTIVSAYMTAVFFLRIKTVTVQTNR